MKWRDFFKRPDGDELKQQRNMSEQSPKQPSPPTPRIETKHSQPDEQIELKEDYLLSVQEKGKRLIFYIPYDRFSVLKRDGILNIFEETFDGSLPTLYQNFGSSFAVEVPYKEKIAEFRQKIDALAAGKNGKIIKSDVKEI